MYLLYVIFRLRTKTGKLENDFAQLQRANGMFECLLCYCYYCCIIFKSYLHIGVPVQPKSKHNDNTNFFEEENKRLKGRVNKYIDEIKVCKEDLEKKKREVANLKRISASRKLDGSLHQAPPMVGKKRPATPDQSELVVGQAPTHRSGPHHEIEHPAFETNDIHHDNSDQMALLNSYKAR